MNAIAVIASDRLLALNWPGQDPHIGVMALGSRLTAWRNTKGLSIAHCGRDVVFKITTKGDNVIIKPTPMLSPSRFYSLVREASDVLGVGLIEPKLRSNRLIAEHKGATYLAQHDGRLIIPI